MISVGQPLTAIMPKNAVSVDLARLQPIVINAALARITAFVWSLIMKVKELIKWLAQVNPGAIVFSTCASCGHSFQTPEEIDCDSNMPLTSHSVSIKNMLVMAENPDHRKWPDII